MIYYIYKDSRGEWRWRLRASNGNILADSGEGYKNELDCINAIRSVQSSSDADIAKEKS
jgi:uncharacterized protein YegP (UPF0339 family)